ncbi:hypothetical protein [Streptomyces lateritius]|uniref:hypothetical protein n=1 Tax=Streptomyces lateritius TaxID=67313 RepID=UPI00167B2806|nr:hypothetical protein [Streptomyces lateritius]GGT84603.1 hypothetical protein GCM10010272_31530 [Streptomyces lateritius]
MTLRRDGDEAVWADWRDPATGDVDMPELRFDAGQYEAEVRRAGEDRSWEWPAGAVAQLLEAKLRRRAAWLDRWKCELEEVWASRAEPDRIHVVLTHPRVRPEEGQPWLQFGMSLPVSGDGPADQAGRLEARVTAGDPRLAAEAWGGSEEHAEQLASPWPAHRPQP